MASLYGDSGPAGASDRDAGALGQTQPAGERLAQQQVHVEEGISNPSFLAFHPNQKYLYAVAEVADVVAKAERVAEAAAVVAAAFSNRPRVQ